MLLCVKSRLSNYVVVFEQLVARVGADRDFGISDVDHTSIEPRDLRHVDDVRTVYSHELTFGQLVLKLF